MKHEIYKIGNYFKYFQTYKIDVKISKIIYNIGNFIFVL